MDLPATTEGRISTIMNAKGGSVNTDSVVMTTICGSSRLLVSRIQFPAPGCTCCLGTAPRVLPSTKVRGLWIISFESAGR